MPKLKTNKSVAKRFRKTASGKIKRKHAKLRHILTTKSPRKRRQLRHKTYVDKADSAKIARMLPYG